MSEAPLLAERRTATLVATCLAAFMTSLDMTIVNVALPTMQASLGGGIAGLQWIGAGYTRSSAACC